jgi:hypothetical protein
MADTLTYNEAQHQAKLVGCTLVRKDGEFRVNFVGGNEDTAYYTNDLADAVGTARLMAKSIEK